MSNTLIPYVSISPRYIATYKQPEVRRVRTQAQRDNEQNLQNNDHQGKISKKANRRIVRAIDWMLFKAKPKLVYPHKRNSKLKFKVNFITLTLSSEQAHSDLKIKKECLQPFLDYSRKVWGVKDYLWRAEAQKNGNIHFHIVTDRYIPWSEIRNVWNRHQERLGYVSKFNEKYPGRTPNSTDVHSVNKVKNLALYLAKYCAKESKYRAINGKNWGLSYGLSRMKSAVEMEYGAITEELGKIWRELKPKVWKSKYVHVMFIEAENWLKLNLENLQSILKNHISSSGVEFEFG